MITVRYGQCGALTLIVSLDAGEHIDIMQTSSFLRRQKTRLCGTHSGPPATDRAPPYFGSISDTSPTRIAWLARVRVCSMGGRAFRDGRIDAHRWRAGPLGKDARDANRRIRDFKGTPRPRSRRDITCSQDVPITGDVFGILCGFWLLMQSAVRWTNRRIPW